MRRVEYGYEGVPISMDKYFIHGCGRSMSTMQHSLAAVPFQYYRL